MGAPIRVRESRTECEFLDRWQGYLSITPTSSLGAIAARDGYLFGAAAAEVLPRKLGRSSRRRRQQRVAKGAGANLRSFCCSRFRRRGAVIALQYRGFMAMSHELPLIFRQDVDDVDDIFMTFAMDLIWSNSLRVRKCKVACGLASQNCESVAAVAATPSCFATTAMPPSFKT